MKIFSVGDVFYGKSYVDMINKALGTHIHEGYMNSCVKLDGFGYTDIVAWFAFMNGEKHGHRKDWIWKNRLLHNNTIIQEKLVSTDTELFKHKRNEEGYFPYRLCFQIDPFEKGDRHCCKFVGFFHLSNFLEENLTWIEYSKTSDEFCLKNISEYEYDEQIKKPLISSESKYKTPISEMGFSNHVYNILKSGSINYAHELLEIGIASNNENLLTELRQKLFGVFKKDVEAYEAPQTIPVTKPKPASLTPAPSSSKKFAFNNKLYEMDMVVLEAVTEFVRRHIDIKKQDLKNAFNFSNLPFNVIEDSQIATALPDYKLNYFHEEDESLPLVDGEVFVWKKWNANDLALFIENIKPLGINIEAL